MIIRPPPGRASRALTTRLINTCSNWAKSALIGPRFWPGRNISSMCSPIILRSILSTFIIKSFRFVTWGSITWCRENASSCRASWAARSPAFWISCRYPLRRLVGGTSDLPSPEKAIIGVKRLLKSWATPPASLPNASIFWYWKS